jgi:cytochrome b561
MRYDAIAMSLHWLIAFLMIFLLVFGEDLIEQEHGVQMGPAIHVSIGTTVLFLTVLRLLWRLANPPPAYPASMAWWEKLAAKITHLLFYVLLIVIPISGWLAIPEFLEDEQLEANLSVFGLPLPIAPNVDLSMDDVHELTSNFTIVLLLMHVLAALKHHLINRDDVLRRILPRRER